MNSSANDPSLDSAVESIVSQAESEGLDFEADVPAAVDAAQLIAGIANSGGGRIVLGADGQGKVSGLGDLEQAESVISEAATSVVPPVNVEFSAETSGDRRVGVVTVPASEGLSLAPEGPRVSRDKNGQIHALTKDEISRKAVPSGPVQREDIDKLVEQVALLSAAVVASQKEAKDARRLKRQLPGLAVGALLGAVLGVVMTAISTSVFG